MSIVVARALGWISGNSRLFRPFSHEKRWESWCLSNKNPAAQKRPTNVKLPHNVEKRCAFHAIPHKLGSDVKKCRFFLIKVFKSIFRLLPNRVLFVVWHGWIAWPLTYTLSFEWGQKVNSGPRYRNFSIACCEASRASAIENHIQSLIFKRS